MSGSLRLALVSAFQTEAVWGWPKVSAPVRETNDDTVRARQTDRLPQPLCTQIPRCIGHRRNQDATNATEFKTRTPGLIEGPGNSEISVDQRQLVSRDVHRRGLE